jgi:16S rRNA (adenine1518-N6/adenine1519-N6)-dimethyltransferase
LSGPSLDPAVPHILRSLLREHGLHPRKRLGQHFLIDGNVLDRIARIALPDGDDPVVEIGPGLGSLTRRLAARSRKVTAVELDSAFGPVLARTLEGFPGVEIVFADFLALDPLDLVADAFGDAGGVVAANIPYNITSPILERLFVCGKRIGRIVLLVQSEVAARLASAAGARDYSSLTVFAQLHAAVRTEGVVPARLFHPRPDVDSTIVVLEPHPAPPVMPADPALFRRVVRAGFGYRRKTLANALAAGGVVATAALAASILASISVDPGRRGESLTLAEFAAVADEVKRLEDRA